jgi:phospholipid-binding lipoprotein MlaA
MEFVLMPLTNRLTVFTLRGFFLSLLLLIGSLPVFAQSNPADPWEKVNRIIYKFNDTLDEAAVRPVAKGYQKIVPRFARTGISNFFNNLDDVNVVVNDVLQLKLKAALQDSGRLLLNTTVGLGGFIDVASEVGWYKNYEDFGQTLGHWGVKPGPYVVLPFLGSSTVRDTVGMIPDTFFNPIFWITDT